MNLKIKSTYSHGALGYAFVFISRGLPRNVLAGYKIYRALAPGIWFNKPPFCENEALYRECYFDEILKPLNAAQVYDDLLALSGGHPPVLLCWEDVRKERQWCHRRIAAEWFEQELGFSVQEYQPAARENSSLQTSLFSVI